MYALTLCLVILLIFYATDYVLIDWHPNAVKKYKELCKILGCQPQIMLPQSSGGCIWKYPDHDKWIRQICIVSDDSKNDISTIQLQMPFALHAGFGNLRINEVGFNKQVQKVMHTVDEYDNTSVMYDPIRRVLMISSKDVNDIFFAAQKCARTSEAFPYFPEGWHPRAELNEYHKKFVRMN